MLYKRSLENLRANQIAIRLSQIFDTMQYYELIDEKALAHGVYDIKGVLPDLQDIQEAIYNAITSKTSLVESLHKPILNITAFGLEIYDMIQRVNTNHMARQQSDQPLIVSNYDFHRNNEYNLAIGYYPSASTYDQANVKSKYQVFNDIGSVFDISLMEVGLSNNMFYTNTNSNDVVNRNTSTATHGITLEDWLMNFLIESLFKRNGIFHLAEIPIETVSSFTQANFLVYVNSHKQAVITSISSNLYRPQATIFRKKVPI